MFAADCGLLLPIKVGAALRWLLKMSSFVYAYCSGFVHFAGVE